MTQDQQIQFLQQALTESQDANRIWCIAFTILAAATLVLCAIAWKVINEKDIKPDETTNPRNPFADPKYSRDGRTINPEWLEKNKDKYPQY